MLSLLPLMLSRAYPLLHLVLCFAAALMAVDCALDQGDRTGPGRKLEMSKEERATWEQTFTLEQARDLFAYTGKNHKDVASNYLKIQSHTRWSSLLGYYKDREVRFAEAIEGLHRADTLKREYVQRVLERIYQLMVEEDVPDFIYEYDAFQEYLSWTEKFAMHNLWVLRYSLGLNRKTFAARVGLGSRTLYDFENDPERIKPKTIRKAPKLYETWRGTPSLPIPFGELPSDRSQLLRNSFTLREMRDLSYFYKSIWQAAASEAPCENSLSSFKDSLLTKKEFKEVLGVTANDALGFAKPEMHKRADSNQFPTAPLSESSVAALAKLNWIRVSAIEAMQPGCRHETLAQYRENHFSPFPSYRVKPVFQALVHFFRTWRGGGDVRSVSERIAEGFKTHYYASKPFGSADLSQTPSESHLQPLISYSKSIPGNEYYEDACFVGFRWSMTN